MTITSIYKLKYIYKISLDRQLWIIADWNFLDENRLEKGANLSHDEISQLERKFLYTKLILYCNKYLNVMDKSIHELQKKLLHVIHRNKKKWYFTLYGNPEEAVEDVIEYYSEIGILNEVDLVERYLRGRIYRKPRSIYVLTRELQAKGIDNEIIQQSILKLELDDKVLLIMALRKKLRRTKIDLNEDVLNNQKILEYLVRLGFNYSVIKGLTNYDLQIDKEVDV